MIPTLKPVYISTNPNKRRCFIAGQFNYVMPDIDDISKEALKLSLPEVNAMVNAGMLVQVVPSFHKWIHERLIRFTLSHKLTIAALKDDKELSMADIDTIRTEFSNDYEFTSSTFKIRDIDDVIYYIASGVPLKDVAKRCAEQSESSIKVGFDFLEMYSKPIAQLLGYKIAHVMDLIKKLVGDVYE